MHSALTGKRVLITQANEFMGPVLCEVFAEQGAEVVASTADLSETGAARRVVLEAGRHRCAGGQPGHPGTHDGGGGGERRRMARVVCRAGGPAATSGRGCRARHDPAARGQILVMGSASALRGMKRASTYSAARGAQLAYAQAVG